MRLLLAILAVIGIVALHITLATTLPWPFSALNITVIALAYLLLTRHATLAIATAFCMGIVMELYAVTPFGVLVTSLVVALTLGSIIASYLITTISPLGMIAVTFTMAVTYRICFLVLIGIIALSGKQVAISTGQALEMIATEGLTTTALMALIVGGGTVLRRKTRARLSTRSFRSL
ncbi:hypothetical protein A3H75_01805 [Candidatus Uhrbacteria bacterium RIFCSPLOWO2_02_FULL_51_9]|uniref:Rod shape-determining protein MreD n=1 Tax=Candidatus Uhrbacteria bacterium RIFCSPLOWO2_02_FULL_51_9 TaxID=1802410 RepID=A0A1F7VCZ2_9BACT|nr:MAG: hypothetical protein A3H75_01805 [Candidatus Uhrbacteria bacterium RIFCSPLOWO2_02_FULL_51_9]